MIRFSSLASTWDEDPNRIKYAEAIASYIRTHIEKDQRHHALEIGAGSGMLSMLLADSFSRIDLVDSSEGMVKQMTKKLEENNIYHLNPVYSSLEAFNPLNLYSVIYCVMFLHHIKNVEDVLKKLHDMTKTDGKVFLCDLYTEDGRFHTNEAEGVYHHGFDPDVLANDLKSIGFGINNIQTVYNCDRHDRLYPMFVIEATKN